MKPREVEGEVVKTRKRVLGEEHSDTLSSISNLSINILESRTMEESRGAERASDEDNEKNARRGASKHAD